MEEVVSSNLTRSTKLNPRARRLDTNFGGLLCHTVSEVSRFYGPRGGKVTRPDRTSNPRGNRGRPRLRGSLEGNNRRAEQLGSVVGERLEFRYRRAPTQVLLRLPTTPSAPEAGTNTFTQFYPTALAVAREKGTVKPPFRPWTPSPEALFHTIQINGWAEARAALEKAGSEEPDATVMRKPVLNQLGYQLLTENEAANAVGVFRFAAAKHPQSANASDRLAQLLAASAAAGRRGAA